LGFGHYADTPRSTFGPIQDPLALMRLLVACAYHSTNRTTKATPKVEIRWVFDEAIDVSEKANQCTEEQYEWKKY